jgi:lipopolysaccharide/colanic/teichoic acid biosynthesis glycosyltransferase
MPARRIWGVAKRGIDLVLGTIAVAVSAPLVAVAAALVFLADRGNPFYVSTRVGRDGRPFRLFKIRTMVVGAFSTGVDTTAAEDPRLLRVGKVLRRLGAAGPVKLDELPQFLHVALGQMSLVGPREVRLYTGDDRGLLGVRPGITDFASIVFSDLPDAIPSGMDPNLGYAHRVPWKSRLGLHYVAHGSFPLDACLLLCTATNFLARRWTLGILQRLLRATRAPSDLCDVVLRRSPLVPAPPPGAERVVSAEDLLGRSV